MTDPSTRERLLELAAGAWRPTRSDGGVGALPEWHDLDEAGRREAFDLALHVRALEAALHPEGLSACALAVLGRLQRG